MLAICSSAAVFIESICARSARFSASSSCGVTIAAPLLAQEVADLRQQLGSVDRFRHVVVAADLESVLDMVALAARGHHDHGDVARGFELAQLSARLEAIHVR